MRQLRKIPESFLASQVDDELILVHGDTGGFFALKDVGLDIWRRLDEEVDLDAISDQICREYDVTGDDCRQSVAHFASQLVDAGFAQYI